MTIKSIPNMLVTVIVDNAYNNESLRSSLDSILIQSYTNLEIIIANSINNEYNTCIIDEYCNRFPQISAVHGPDNISALNSAFKHCAGHALVLLTTMHKLTVDFINSSLAVMEEHMADIVTGGVYTEGKPDTIILDEEGIYSGSQSLEVFLKRPALMYSPYGCVFRVARCCEQNIPFELGIPYTGLEFAARAFYHSRKTIALRMAACMASTNTPRALQDHPTPLRPFVAASIWLNNFLQLNLEDTQVRKNCLTKLYREARLPIFNSIIKAHRVNNRKRILDYDTLMNFSHCRPVLENIIADYAQARVEEELGNPAIDPDDFDWRKAAAVEFEPITYESFESLQKRQSPLLTVIMANYNKQQYLPRCLDSILEQDMPDFEVIVVDDASTDGSFKLLQEYAAIYDNIRLFRMKINSGQSACQNLALDQAHGKYIIFVDSDDYVMPRFFHTAVNTIRETGADMVFFPCQFTNENWEVRHKQNVCERVCFKGGSSMLQHYIDGTFITSTWGKVFKAEFISLNNVRFERGLYHQDHHFMLDLGKNAHKIVLDPFIAYSLTISSNSSIRPKYYKYRHIHSVCRLFGKWRLLMGSDWTPSFLVALKHGIWNLENVGLYAWAAFLNATHEVALSDADYAILKDNYPFMIAILLGQALCLERTGMLKRQSLSVFSGDNPTELVKPGPVLSIFLFEDMRHEDQLMFAKTLAEIDYDAYELLAFDERMITRMKSCMPYMEEKFVKCDMGKNLEDFLSQAKGEYILFASCKWFDFYPNILHSLALLLQRPRAAFAKLNRGAESEEVGADFLFSFADCGWEDYELFSGSLHEYIFKKEFLSLYCAHFPCDLLDGNLLALEAVSHDGYCLCTNCHVQEKSPEANLDSVRAISELKALISGCRHLAGEWDELSEGGRLLSKFWLADNLRKINRLWRACSEVKSNAKYLRLEISTIANNDYPPMFMEGLLSSLDTKSFDYLKSVENHEAIMKYESKLNSGYDFLKFNSTMETASPPMLSIIIYCKDSADELDAAFLSVKEQSVKDLEILILDNASSDETLNIAKTLATQNGNVSILHAPISAARHVCYNEAAKAATGRYILFMDSSSLMAASFLSQVFPPIEGPKIFAFACTRHKNMTALERWGYSIVGGNRALAIFIKNFRVLPDMNGWILERNFLLNSVTSADSYCGGAFFYDVLKKADKVVISSMMPLIRREVDHTWAERSNSSGTSMSRTLGQTLNALGDDNYERLLPIELELLRLIAESDDNFWHDLKEEFIKNNNDPNFNKLGRSFREFSLSEFLKLEL